jgi:phosphopantetheinyl transferase (holo-ACP synthase)
MNRKYQTEEERKIAHKEQQNKYAAKAWTCKECKCTIRLGNKWQHLKSIKHKNNTK